MKASNPKGGLLIAAMVGLAVVQPLSGMAQSVTVQGVVDGLLSGILGGGRTNPPQPVMAEEARRQMVNVLSGTPYNVPRADAEAFVAQLTEALTRDNAPRSFTSPSGVRMSIAAGPAFTRSEGQCRIVQAGMKRAERGPDEVRVDATFCWTGQHWGTLQGDITGALAAPRQQQQQPGRQAAQQPTQQSSPPPSRRDIPVAEELDETRTVRTSTVMRAEPTTQSASVRQLTAGQRIQLTGNLRGSPWVRIEANGMRGWVLLSTLSEPENIPARPATTAPPSSPTPQAPAPQQAAPTGNIWQRMQEANPQPPAPFTAPPQATVPVTPTAPARTQEAPRPAPQAPAPVEATTKPPAQPAQAAQPPTPPTPIPATPPAAVVQPTPQPPQEAAPPAQTAPAPQPPARQQRRLDASM